MIWILFALIAAMLFAVTNVVDNYYINKLFRSHLSSSVFYGHVIKAILIFGFFIVFSPAALPMQLLPFFILIGLLDILYVLPYFRALQIEDTSIVVALWGFGKIFVPILAFFTVNEFLTTNQYIGFIIIIVSSSLLSLRKMKKKFRLNMALPLMILSSLLISLQSVIYKHIFQNTDWLTGFAWSYAFIGLTTLSMLLVPPLRNTILSDFSGFKKRYHVVATNSLVSISAWALTTYAISLTDVTLVKGITASEPFFVMIYALLFSKFFPNLFKEGTGRKNILKKSLLFAILILGIIIITR